jgi:hypothetical protein
MEDHTEIVRDLLELPEPPTELEALRDYVYELSIYVRTLSRMNTSTWKEIIKLRKKLQELGINCD